ncbi:MAG: hypothetical protein R6V35_05555 [Candidatus Nanohaloarchaea archaeon]
MRKSGLILVFIVLFLTGAAAQVTHSLDVEESQAKVNTTLELDSDREVNSWNINYRLPENSEIIEIRDSYGEIEEYTYSDRRLELKTNTGDRRQEEYLRINYIINKEENSFSGLNHRTFNFAGFDGEKTSGKVEVENLISGSISQGFQASYNKSMNFEGSGPVQFTVNYGEAEESDYFIFFGEELNYSDMDQAYEIALGTVGYQQNFERFPVVVREDFEGQEWSAGEYTQGRIYLRPSDDAFSVLTHETVHGLNDRLFSWDRTSSSWMDEGIAKHAEDLARISKEGRERNSNLFGGSVKYREDSYIYTLPSRGDRDELWSYYENDEDWMKDWAPRKGNRSFGYAYSELVVKNYVKNNNSIQDIYSQAEQENRVEDNKEKWSIYSEFIDMRPCDYDSRSRFDECLDEINNQRYRVLLAQPSESRTEVAYREAEIPERELNKPLNSDFSGLIEKLVKWLNEVLGL